MQINSHDQCSSETIDHRCIKHLQILLRGTALDAYSDLATGTLEWRTGALLEQLREQGRDVQTRAPNSWNEWVDAYTNLYSPPNRIAILARATAELKYEQGQTIDSYALEVAKAHSRFYAEATRVTPKGRDPVSFAREVSQTAAFEAGLPPHIRVETIREDPTHSFQIARARAKKHEANNLRGTASENSASAPHVSSLAINPSKQLAETVADLDGKLTKLLKARNHSADRGRSMKRSPSASGTQGKSTTPRDGGKRVRFETSSRSTSKNPSSRRTSSGKDAQQCTY